MKLGVSVLIGVAAFGGFGNAACSSDLVVDDFATYSENRNRLSGWTSGKQEQLAVLATSGSLIDR